RQRLLDVDVLARVAGVDHLQGVPVVGRRDDHGVDILALEQPAIVAKLLRLAAALLGGGVHVRLVGVADSGGLAILLLEEDVWHLIAAIAQANEAEAHAFAGAEHARGGHSGGHAADGGAGGEGATGDLGHGRVSWSRSLNLTDIIARGGRRWQASASPLVS